MHLSGSGLLVPGIYLPIHPCLEVPGTLTQRRKGGRGGSALGRPHSLEEEGEGKARSLVAASASLIRLTCSKPHLEATSGSSDATGLF